MTPRARALRVLPTLTRRERLAVALRFSKRLPLLDVAEVMGHSPECVRDVLVNVRAKIALSRLFS